VEPTVALRSGTSTMASVATMISAWPSRDEAGDLDPHCGVSCQVAATQGRRHAVHPRAMRCLAIPVCQSQADTPGPP